MATVRQLPGLNKKTVSAVLLLSLLLAVAIWDRTHRDTVEINMPVVEQLATHLSPVQMDVRFDGKSLSFVKEAQPSSAWQLASIDGTPVIDTRANDGMVRHLLDVLKTLRRTNAKDLSPKDGSQYGLDRPRLALSVYANSHESNPFVVQFGDRDSSGKRVYAYFPQGGLLIQTQATILDLVEHRSFLDLRDRRLFTFDPDDVENLDTVGHCRHLSLARNGDHWEWNTAAVVSSDQTDAWLEKLLSLSYEAIDEAKTAATTGEIERTCRLVVKGRMGRKETLSITPSLWSLNSALPARYRASPLLAQMLGITSRKK